MHNSQVIFISTFIYRYDFKLVDSDRDELEVAEGFLRKVSCTRLTRHTIVC